jgi:hypothetical protein
MTQAPAAKDEQHGQHRTGIDPPRSHHGSTHQSSKPASDAVAVMSSDRLPIVFVAFLPLVPVCLSTYRQ